MVSKVMLKKAKTKETRQLELKPHGKAEINARQTLGYGLGRSLHDSLQNTNAMIHAREQSKQNKKKIQKPICR